MMKARADFEQAFAHAAPRMRISPEVGAVICEISFRVRGFARTV